MTSRAPARTERLRDGCWAWNTEGRNRMVSGAKESSVSRRLRLGMVGGGPGAFIGAVHRTAARFVDLYEVVAAVLSSDPQKSSDSASALTFPERMAVSVIWRGRKRSARTASMRSRLQPPITFIT